MKADIQEVLINEEALEKRIKELGAEISETYKHTTPILIGILKGSIVFFADLIRTIKLPIEVEFLKASSYGSGARSSGKVSLENDLHFEVKGKDILLIEDIVDTGNTLKFLLASFKKLDVKSVRVCSLLDKPDRREQSVNADFIGFEIPNEFVVGYGLDYDQKYRNLPFIGILKPEKYE